MIQVQRSIERGAEMYLRALRPTVTLGCLLTYVCVWVVGAASPATYRMMLLFGIAAALGTPYVLALRRFRARQVVGVSLYLDAVMIAILIWGTGTPHYVTIGYLWPVAVASYFFSWRLATGALVFAALLSLSVAAISDVTVPVNAQVSEMLGLLAVGSLLIYIGSHLRSYENTARLQRMCDQATLRLASGMRADVASDEPLKKYVEEIGTAMGADRCLLRVFGTPELSERIVQWTARGLEPQPVKELDETAIGPVMRGEPVYAASLAELEDPAKVREFQRLGIESDIGMPIVWEQTVVGLVSLQSRRPHDWTTDALPILRRLAPTVGTILAQQHTLEHQRKALEALQQLGSFRERLVATTSHELRTPLTVVRGYLELLGDTTPDLSSQQLERIHAAAMDSADRLLHITENLLELSRMQRDVPPIQPVDLNLRDLVDRALIAHAPDATTSVDQPAESVGLRADPIRLQQALDNLVSNAARYGNGEVLVSVRESAGWVEIAVSDDGEGVSEEHERQLFTPFSSFSGRPDSTGLGLAVSRAVVEAHGGSLHYEPACDTAAHAFVIRLPRRQANPEQFPPAETPASGGASPVSASVDLSPTTRRMPC